MEALEENLELQASKLKVSIAQSALEAATDSGDHSAIAEGKRNLEDAQAAVIERCR